MINISTEFKELMKTRTDFKQYAEITLTDGAVWAVDESDFTIDNNSISDSAGADGLPLGVVVSRTIQIELMNDDDRFADVDFMGAEIRLYLTFQLSETIERVELGYFTVISPETYGETVIIEAMDNSWKLDTPYITSLAYPQSAGAVFRDICTRCSVLAESSDFLNNDFVIESAPDSGLTNREMIGYIAMIAGGNARFNRHGKLEILTYEFPTISIKEEENYDGGTFDDWDSGDTLDGGTLDDWASGDDTDGGAFDPWDSSSGSGGENIVVDDDTHVLASWISLKPFTEDIVITGIQTTKRVEDSEGNETETPVMYGADGYVLSIENPLISGKEEAALALIGDVLVGARIRNFEGDHIGYPLAKFMDKAVIVDRKGNAMPTVLTDINFNFFGITTMANSAAPPLRLSSKYNSAAAQAIIAAKDLVAKEKTQRELAIEALNTALSNSSGLYPTKVVQPDGSIISYLHDKPTLEESQTVIKVTAEAIGVSNDGGETYSYGFFTNGDAILNILQAEGINADWINAGAFRITDNRGNVLFDADIDTKSVTISGNILQIISDYFSVARDGKITATGGKIGGFNIDKNLLYTEDHQNPAGQFVPGVVLDTENGIVSVGVGSMKSNSDGIARFGTENYYIIFEESGNYYADDITVRGTVGFNDEASFAKETYFAKEATFNVPVSVSSGGTGATYHVINGVVLGDGSDPLKTVRSTKGAFYSAGLNQMPQFGVLPPELGGTGMTSLDALISTLSVECGQAQVTLSTSTTETSVSLADADKYAIVANPNMDTGNPINWTVCKRTTTGFTIKCAPNSALNGRTVGFDWIAKKLP